MTEFGYRYVVNVEGAILHEGRYLMVRRGVGERHAPGTLAFPGGKVEVVGVAANVLEATLRREIQEEVGIGIRDEVAYVESKAFISDEGDPVVDVVFLCRYQSGAPTILDPDEVETIQWLRADEVLADLQAPPWTRQSITLAEAKRQQLGW